MASSSKASMAVKTKIKTTRKTERPNEDVQGRNQSMKSFLAFHNSEPKCAAYLGFDNIGDFRRLEFSYTVISYYNAWFRYCTGHKSYDVALELIRDITDATDIDLKFPKAPAVAILYYGPNADLKNPQAIAKLQNMERDSNANYLAATLIYRLTEKLESEPEEYGEEYKFGIAKIFFEYTGRSLPILDTSVVPKPKLGPHVELGEVPVEKFNRVLNLFRSITHTISGKRWEEKMLKDPFAPVKVHPSYIPRWMLKEKAPTISPTVPSFPPKLIHLVHNAQQKTKYSESLDRHLEEWVEPQGLEMPAPSQLPNKDPRYFESGEQWRDTVRRQFNMETLKLEFFTMYLQYSEQPDSASIKLPVFGPMQAKLWSEIRGILLQTDLKVQFLYTLRPLEPEEGFEPEYDGVPISLEADFRIGADGDIERIATRDPESENTQDTLEHIENIAFLSGGGTAIKRRPIPQSEYSINDRQRMLEEHSGYDVFTEKGLRDWQRFVIETIARTQPRLTSDSGFAKGGKKLTQKQREELQELREEGERITLAADVSYIPIT